jgi:Ca2+-transporting ATPase
MQQTSWHAEPVAEVLRQLQAAAGGLSDDAAARRLARYGPNQLTPPRPASAFKILLDQLKGVVVALLLAAVGISFLLGDRIEAAAIAGVLLINMLIGFTTELRSRRAMEALLQFDVPRASVFRGGQLRTVAASALVPGDVVELGAGRHVPADARLTESADLRTIEAALTGESLPVSKEAADVLPAETVLAERTNMVYKGTTIAAGTALAVVTATGAATEVGRIGTLVADVREERTPLERRLDALGRQLVWLALAVAALIAGLTGLQGAPLELVIKTGIALAVAAVPEALPAVATIALAVGLHRMAKRHALVRRLPAVEALGSATIVCTDKTRTLTSGDMSIVRVWTAGRDFDVTDDASLQDASHPSLRLVLEVGSLASRPQAEGPDHGGLGDPVDLALLHAAERAGIDRTAIVRDRPAIGLVPFSSRRKLMASFHRDGAVVAAYVKGAPRAILALCDRSTGGDGEQSLDDEGRQRLLDVNGRLAARGLRVLAVAAGAVESPQEDSLRGLTFVGFVGLMDPPARGVKETIELLRAAGLRTVMLTGDQRLTAEAVGKALGTLRDGDQVAEGRDVESLSESELTARLGSVGAFSRVSPEHKLTIVRALQARGDIVTMLGDGVNDAPALKQADVGVAMGIRGTDVAKEAAAVVLQDDKFDTIAAAVEEGRIIYDNIRKFVFYLFSCNVAEVMVLLVAGVAGLPLPLMPLQILWLNMVTDTFPALALALEPGDPDVMRRPPRDPREALLSWSFLARILLYGSLITASTMAAYLWALAYSTHSVSISFMTLALAQILHLGNARSSRPVFQLAHAFANPYALGAVALAIGLQIAPLYVPILTDLLQLEPLQLREWGVVIGLGALPALVGQAIKVWKQRKAPSQES